MVSRPAGGDTHHSPSRPGVIIINSATAQTEAWFSLKELVSTQGIQSMRGGVKLSSHNCACLMVAQVEVPGAQSFSGVEPMFISWHGVANRSWHYELATRPPN